MPFVMLPNSDRAFIVVYQKKSRHPAWEPGVGSYGNYSFAAKALLRAAQSQSRRTKNSLSKRASGVPCASWRW